MRRVVVLPQPDGPTKTMNSLSRICEVDVLHHVRGVEVLVQLGQRDLGHDCPYPLTEPVRPET